MEAAISGVSANTASVWRMSALSSRGTGEPTNPKREATGSQDWFSYITTRAFSSCDGVCVGGGGEGEVRDATRHSVLGVFS